MDHLVSYVSGLFHGSQLNWATLMKEAYAIYCLLRNLHSIYRSWNYTQEWIPTPQEVPEENDS